MLLHLNVFVKRNFSDIAFLSNQEDEPLSESCVESSHKPLWILASDQLSEIAILDAIKDELGSYEDIALLYEKNTETIQNWCQRHNWRFIPYTEMAGSEASVIVLFDLNLVQYYINECYSRARTRLIIVHR